MEAVAAGRLGGPAALRGIFASLPSALVCFSGGADSALVVALAHEALGRSAFALTAVSPSLPAVERKAAMAFCQSLGAQHIVVETRELENPAYASNPADRCFHCKNELYTVAFAEARARGLAQVLDGFNQDDEREHRPGRKAAVEHGVRSPLAEAGFDKAAVRALSKELGLPTWDKPAAPCLSSRIPTGTPVTLARLTRIAAAEEAMRSFGFRVFRVRHHEDVARLEVAADELSRLADADLRARVGAAVRATGFRFVAVDLEPFASGRLSRQS
jgi:pyridinium-3,5-biscarboxylic acid mononucleotide sulfurtransferase